MMDFDKDFKNYLNDSAATEHYNKIKELTPKEFGVMKLNKRKKKH